MPELNISNKSAFKKWNKVIYPELKVSNKSAFKKWKPLVLTKFNRKIINSMKFKILVFNGKVKILN